MRAACCGVYLRSGQLFSLLQQARIVDSKSEGLVSLWKTFQQTEFKFRLVFDGTTFRVELLGNQFLP
jgi:hypothetical protein